VSLNRFKTTSIATVFTVIFSVVIALILPVGYFFISYEHLKGILETEAEINSKLVSRIISTNPELWRYETIRIEELLVRRPRSGAAETRRIFDVKDILVAESVNHLRWPRIISSHEIRDCGETVGRIEISRSILPIFLRSGILAVFGLGFGLLLYRCLPFRALIKAGKRLKDNNEFLKKVMEGSTNSLVVLDLTGNIHMFNGRFEALSGYTCEELQGRNFFHLFTGEAKSQVALELQNILSKKTEKVIFETVFLRQDGSGLSLSIGAVPLLSEGMVNGTVVSLDDITDRVNAEEERLVLERHLQQTQKLESLGVLAGGIAHDFNNILAIIIGYCGAIKDDINSKSATADYIQKIEGATNRAGDLCQQMLTYAGKNELYRTRINMNLLVDDLVKMLHSGIKKNVTIDLRLCDDLSIIADSSQIQQIVMNLIINAAEAIADNNGIISICLERADVQAGQSETDFHNKAILAGRYACLKVSDNGCGMDAEKQNRMFEPFYTTKFTGRGLGMSATLGIIKSHDGALQLSSKPGIGTTFKVYFPLAEVNDTADTAPTVAQATATKGKGTILLVDDEEELRVLGSIRLDKFGFSAITTANGLEALEIYREQDAKIDLILLDMLMPEMNGIETYHRLREISLTIPIIFCSGCSKNELSDDILADEYTGFLKKPYKSDQLQKVLMNMLGQNTLNI